MNYRREVDGLRAIAVIPVVLFHAGFTTTLSGGFVGVDIFFVISGYLITRNILDGLEAGSFSLVTFYERRARRILPALFFMMACTLPFAWYWMLPISLKQFSESLVAVSLFSSNMLFYLIKGYFETGSELQPLLHTWSLAVEEQFYILYPLFLILLWRLGKKLIILLLAIVAIVSICFAQWATINNPTFNFYLLPTRVFELIIGALISFCFNFYTYTGSIFRKNDQILSLIGIILILYSFFTFNSYTPSPGIYTLVPTLGTALIIMFANPKNIVGKLLGSKILVGCGLISYSAYLWHQPLLAFARLRGPAELPTLVLIVICFGTFIIGFISWRYVEMPFRRAKKNSGNKILSLLFGLALIFIVIGLIGYSNNGFPARIKSGTINILIDKSELINIPQINNGWCFYSVETIKGLSLGEDALKCSIGTKSNAKYKGLLFGDSFAGQYEPFWDEIGKKNNFQIDSITTNWCYPSLNKGFSGPLSSKSYGQCLFNREFFVENYRKYDFIILGGNWFDMLRRNELDEVLNLIKTLTTDAKLIIVMPSPKQYDQNPWDSYSKQFLFETKFDIKKVPAKKDSIAQRANDRLLDESVNYSNVIFLKRDTIFQGDEVSTDGLPLSAEGLHLSIYGSKYIFDKFKQQTEYSDLIERIIQ
jgi:peptidoglycan/LPS O-acetylase OafA/YrhL